MSEEGGHGGKILEANHSLAVSNSDNSGGDNDNCGNKPPDSSSNNPTAVAPPPSTVAQKRSRRYGVSKNKSGSQDGPNECKASGSGSGSGGGGDSDHEIHIWTERERRKKMKNKFSNLHVLLPHLPAKTDKATIVYEAVNYIQTLQQTLQKLQEQKLEKLRGAPSSIELEPSSSVAPPAVAQESRESFLADQGFSNTPKNLDIITINNSANSLGFPSFPISLQSWSSPNVVFSVSGNDAQICVCTPKKPGLLATVFYVLEKYKLEVVTANISSDNYRSMYMIHAHANGAANQLSEALPVEEIYKQAVGEMNFWFSS
ncbi:hypothetical protein NE237_019176 [Protea cynaroides]|uniref:BHLH domain-containing protein n=1 Tax=Protea cynaroides TaxID=273540 RepID=A0A9Q0KBD1_9MAGN|nr:hypothetical protein NE237_019176 [Protea cynaroides]